MAELTSAVAAEKTVQTKGLIREFRGSDREPLRKILEATGVFRKEEVEVALELMDASVNDPSQTDYLLATYEDEDGTVRGYYCYGHTSMTRSTYDLYWIAVDPTCHGGGIGSALLEHCERRIAASGGTLIVVETSSLPKYEPTRRFYRRHRYDETARLRGYYAPDDDLVIYTKHL
jgi:ribosomal protein S18 acetylase RimI-like enzyme